MGSQSQASARRNETSTSETQQCKLTPAIYIGAWTIHAVCIIALKILYDIIPGVSQELSWTLVNITYIIASFLMFHWVRGVPFEFNAGAYDNLNMWEQIDNGDQYTPAKKFLLSVPIVLFLLSTHYTHYDLTYFMINLSALLVVVIPKLPFVSCLPQFLIDEALMILFAESSDESCLLFRGSGGSIGWKYQWMAFGGE